MIFTKVLHPSSRGEKTRGSAWRACRRQSRAEPVARDPQTRETYVLVRKEAYERMKALLPMDDYDPDEGPAINEVMTEDDASDPLLEGYQQ